MADSVRIPDASPLIVLAKVGRVDLLGPVVVVPRAVADEVLARPEEDPARRSSRAVASIPAPISSSR